MTELDMMSGSGVNRWNGVGRERIGALPHARTLPAGAGDVGPRPMPDSPESQDAMPLAVDTSDVTGDRIRVSELTKLYGNRRGIRDVSFGVHSGITGLLGPNGAGKTTLIRCLAGLFTWDKGRVVIDGVDAGARPRLVRRSVGFMPERVSFPAELRVDAYLAFVARMKGVRKAEREASVDTALQRAGLVDVRARLIGNLSKGYRQRVGLAQGLLGDPPVVLLDEPLAGLDPLNVIEIRETLRQYARDRAVFVSTHTLGDVRMMCDRVLVLSLGNLVYDGTTSGLATTARRAVNFRIRVRAAHDGFDAAIKDARGSLISAHSVNDTEYVLDVAVADDDSLSDVVHNLVLRDCRILGVEPTSDALESAFRDAVLAAIEESSG